MNPHSHPPHHHAGTLTYTRRGLFVLSLWLLWGDFAFSFFESVFARFLPIYLKELDASNTLIGIMSGSFAGLVNVLFLPGISRWSDNFRSRIGRRIPFLCVITPLVVGTLILIGLAPEIGGWVFRRFASHLPETVSRGGLVLGLLSTFVVSFHFFNMVLVNAYNWLIRDVVPLEVMARFLAWFRIVGTVSSVIFLWYVFPHLLTHRKEIFLAVGLFYLVVFLVMCFRVKEGDYPPPEKKNPGVLKTFAVYFRDCLQVPLYRRFFLVYLLVIAALNCAGNFTTLFMKETLGITMDGMGHIFSWTAVLSALVFFPVGWLCDRISPMRVTLWSIAGLCLCPILAYLAVSSSNTYLIYSLLLTFPSVAWALGSMATSMLLFPTAKFGQFSSGLNVFGCGGMIAGNFLIGLLMDLVHNDYRVAFLWTTVFAASAIFPMIQVIRGWKQHGGPENYVPPLPE
ncbi:MAG: MFS transporter [Terrimicrobiaceae bacterium]